MDYNVIEKALCALLVILAIASIVIAFIPNMLLHLI